MTLKNNRQFLQLAISLCFLLMVGCSTTVKKPDAILAPGEIEQVIPGIDKEGRVISVPAPTGKKYTSSPVVKGLLDRSQRKFEIKDYVAAANYLERGINISPNDPLLWQRLALIRFEQGNYHQAKQLAKKSNVLVESDKDLRGINEGIIQQVDQLLMR